MQLSIRIINVTAVFVTNRYYYEANYECLSGQHYTLTIHFIVQGILVVVYDVAKGSTTTDFHHNMIQNHVRILP